MNLHILSIGHKEPPWVREGFAYYAARLPSNFTLELINLPARKRSKNQTAAQIKQAETDTLLNAIPKHCVLIALDEQGKQYTSQQVAAQIGRYRDEGLNLALLIGGADGLSPACLQRADAVWSLSKLTYPHALVRVIAAEAIYRAWTLLNNHPYHRE